ncbi:Rv3654c family TadE-like protein [Microbacterium amylolyticum]|uniref:Secretion/DNA translocation related TadE-like protein n=1 Tax=Microbacterium amylolyticum TaxID=936337 RepID=A0ABS4ZJL7_9MICO|nr:Rv3654c family TadE-like protein [Microbacterium amylolyticum]MBP2437482.1 secretion/DNA translocation related TadE-like protein [Microbacterium amylolyticum]
MGGAAFTGASVAATAVVVAGLALAGGAAAESHRVAGAADAAALAAADTLSGFAGGEPCDRAHRVASAASVGVTICELSGRDATIEVRGTFIGLPVIARARAGPPR